jgi:hypothetical protein
MSIHAISFLRPQAATTGNTARFADQTINEILDQVVVPLIDLSTAKQRRARP